MAIESTELTANRFQSLINTAALLVVGGFLGAVAVAYFSGGSPTGQWGTVVNATASQGEDNFTIATGLVDQDLEGFFFLDFITGDLRGAILSRRTGKFSGFFEYNVQADFGTQTQNPKYLMVTGLADLPRGKGPSQLARCVVYVAEATSGQVYAYALPYNGSLNAKGSPQQGSFIMVDGGPFRTTFVRGQ
ncbi:hypothetical protein [Adhaeretor mobilis]|nr:hypothetical protein [Adhaeretor mobilis]